MQVSFAVIACSISTPNGAVTASLEPGPLLRGSHADLGAWNARQ
jgi:hypothetical protein